MMQISDPRLLKDKLDTEEGRNWLSVLDELNYKVECARYDYELAKLKYETNFYRYKQFLGIAVTDQEAESYKLAEETLNAIKGENYEKEKSF